MASKIIRKYKNGDYNIILFENGSKIRISNNSRLNQAEFPESIDIKITNYCDMACPYCHEKSDTNGKHANLDDYDEFLSTLKPGTELAIGGGNPMSNPKNLFKFLTKMKNQGVICNLTINQKHLNDEKTLEILDNYMTSKLIHGLGISLMNVQELKGILRKFDDLNKSSIVIHTIAGVHNLEDFTNLANLGNIKTLVLGYKTFGRGKDYKLIDLNISKKINELNKELPNLFKKFDIVSFDNLALSQLSIENLVDEEVWNKRYMGDDGTFTMYVDLVTGTYRPSSTSQEIFELNNNDTSKSIFKNILQA